MCLLLEPRGLPTMRYAMPLAQGHTLAHTHTYYCRKGKNKMGGGYEKTRRFMSHQAMSPWCHRWHAVGRFAQAK